MRYGEVEHCTSIRLVYISASVLSIKSSDFATYAYTVSTLVSTELSDCRRFGVLNQQKSGPIQ